MAVTLYLTATDHINKHPYTVMVPPYILTIHQQIKSGELFAPFYEPFDDKLPQRAKITIAKMVELCISKTTFTIVDDYDVLVILHQIDAYVEEVYPLRTETGVGKYINMILLLREKIYFHFRRILEHRPQWKTAYSEGMGIFAFLTRLYKPMGISIDLPQTLLEELAICPTIRNNPDRMIESTSSSTGTSGMYTV